MTISSTDDPRAGPFNGNGAQVAFPFEFKVFAEEDLLVVQTDDEGVETTLVLDSDYSVSLNADQNADPGGTVTAMVAPPTGETLTIVSNLEFTQETDITNGGGFYPEVFENALDRGVMLAKQVNEKVGRALQMAVSTPDGVDVTLPVPVGLNIIGWNDDGTQLRNFGNADGVSVVVQADDLDAALRNDADAEEGSGQVFEDLSLAYPVGSVGWWHRHAGVSLLRFMPISTHAAIVAGTNTTNLATYLQVALTLALTLGISLDGHGYTYKSNSALTMQRSAAGDAQSLVLQNATLDFSGLTASGSAVALTVGATGMSYFAERGRIVLRHVSLLGPESDNCSVSGGVSFPAPNGTTTGLRLTYAGDVVLDSVFVRRFYKGIKVDNSWPVHGRSVNCASNYIGIHLGSVSTLGTWEGCSVQNAAYGLLMMPDVAGDNIEAQKFDTLRVENCLQGVTLDPLQTGSNTTVFRNITLLNPRFEQVAYDLVRLGASWTFATPQTFGSNRTDYTQGIFLYGGSWDAPVGAGTNYRVRASTNGFVRGGDIDIACSERSQINGTLVGVTIKVEHDPNGGATAGNTYWASGSQQFKGVDRILAERQTGWAAPTGTATRTTFATGAVTLPQLAERVKALIDDLTAHGLIGP